MLDFYRGRLTDIVKVQQLTRVQFDILLISEIMFIYMMVYGLI